MVWGTKNMNNKKKLRTIYPTNYSPRPEFRSYYQQRKNAFSASSTPHFSVCPGYSRGLGHEVIIEKTLSFGESTAHNMFIFFGHLFLHICFDSSQQKGS